MSAPEPHCIAARQALAGVSLRETKGRAKEGLRLDAILAGGAVGAASPPAPVENRTLGEVLRGWAGRNAGGAV